MKSCPFRNMNNLNYLPCCHQQRGNWVYCSFCNQREEIETPLDGNDIIGALLTLITILILGRAFLFGASRPEFTPFQEVDIAPMNDTSGEV
ncbi:MAG: hypothetical protein ACFBSC_17075 [Microcoleaceae cyanobacterium]